MESREYMGYWWIEDAPNNAVPGSIEYTPSNGIQLRLMGDLSDGIVSSNRSVETFDKILGRTEEGKLVSLLDCRRDKSSVSNGARTSTYIARYFIEGFAFQNQNPALDRMSISFYGMDKWAGLANPRPSDEFLKDPSSMNDKVSVHVDVPDPLSAWRNGVELQINTHTNLNMKLHEEGKIEIDHQFLVKPRRTQVSFEEYIPHINKLNNFIALGLGHPTDPRYVSGKVRTFDGTLHDVNIFYNLSNGVDKDINVHPLRMPFRPPDIANDFPRVLNFWYERSEEIGEIYDLYFATVFQDSMYPENRFLSLCHGLESYHRKRFMDTFMDSSDFDSVYDDFISLLKGSPSSVYSSLGSSADNLRTKHDIPGPFVQALEDGTIKHGNKKSLRRRLKEVITAVRPVLNNLPYSIVGKHKKVSDTRNFFAHRTDELRRKAAHGPEQIQLIWGLQQLIETCLLLEIGIHPDLIENRLNSRYANRWVS
jgi:hypothetical protein